MSNKASKFDLSGSVYEFTRTGLKVVGESTERDWTRMGRKLRAVEEARQWAIGDWLVDGKTHYGDGLYERASKILGLQEDTLQQFKRMANLFEIRIRIRILSYGHHLVVSGIKPVIKLDDGTLELGKEPDYKAIKQFLNDAVDNKWSVAKLREKVQEYKQGQQRQIEAANAPPREEAVEWGEHEEESFVGDEEESSAPVSKERLEELQSAQLQHDLKLACRKIKEAARFFDQANIALLKQRPTLLRFFSAYAELVEQAERMRNFHPESDEEVERILSQ